MNFLKQSFLLIILSVFSFNSYSQDYAAFVKNGKLWQLVDNTGKELCEPIYYIYPDSYFYNGYTHVKKNKKEYGFLSIKGEFKTVENITQASSFSEGMAPYRAGKLWGYVNTDIEVAIKPTYLNTKPFDGGKAWVKLSSGKWTQIDKTGKQVISGSYDAFHNFKNGVARVKNESKWGFIDLTGKEIAGGIKYDKNENFFNGYACVKLGDYWGIIDKQGTFKIKAENNKINGFLKKGYAVLNKDGVASLVDKNLTTIAADYDRIKVMRDGYSIVMKNSQWGLISPKGKVLAKPQFEKVLNLNEGNFIITKNGQKGYLSTSGEVKILGKYEAIKKFTNGVALVKKADKWGYINSSFTEIISPRYIRANDFFDGLATAKEADTYGYIDKTGKYVIASKFQNAEFFVEDLRNNINYKCDAHYKDTKAKSKISGMTPSFGLNAAMFDKRDFHTADIARVKINDKWGFINKKGELVIEGLENAEFSVNGYYRVRKNGKWGFIDKNGKLIVSAKYTASKEMVKICN